MFSLKKNIFVLLFSFLLATETSIVKYVVRTQSSYTKLLRHSFTKWWRKLIGETLPTFVTYLTFEALENLKVSYDTLSFIDH